MSTTPSRAAPTYLLRNGIHGRLRVGRNQDREHAGVGNAQVRRPVHLEVTVHNAYTGAR